MSDDKPRRNAKKRRAFYGFKTAKDPLTAMENVMRGFMIERIIFLPAISNICLSLSLIKIIQAKLQPFIAFSHTTERFILVIFQIRISSILEQKEYYRAVFVGCETMGKYIEIVKNLDPDTLVSLVSCKD